MLRSGRAPSCLPPSPCSSKNIAASLGNPNFMAPTGAEPLEDQFRKEVAYREEVAKQLQLVRGEAFVLVMSRLTCLNPSSLICELQMRSVRSSTKSGKRVSQSSRS